MSEQTLNDIEHIAVIGMAGRFPKANSVQEFWNNLRDGVHCSTEFSDDELRGRGLDEESICSSEYVKSGMVLDNIDLFDADFFGYNAKEAQTMDPQQRIFLELAWEALEDAGCCPEIYDGSIGVFAGTGASDYVKRIPASQNSLTSGFDSFQAMMGNDVDFLTTRVSYKLNLTGPSLTLQTACSTSLVAVHMASQQLISYQCDVALAGGVSIRLPQDIGYMYRDGMIWSPDGVCRAFDANSQGTVFGRGAGIVVLKRLSEAIEEKDHIYAVIKGTAINNDGALKVGYTAPSVEGQSQVISLAQNLSNTPAHTIDYIEAHGTGTPLGDPIEIEALTQTFRKDTDQKGFCAIGSVKTNIGHLDTAAGIAGLIKTVMALKHREIPPSLHFTKPNPNIDFAGSPFYVVNSLKPWPETKSPRRAGVSAFGIGGTNSHAVLEEAPLQDMEMASRKQQLLLLSAKNEAALDARCESLAHHLEENPEISLADTAYTLVMGRTHFKHRRVIVASNPKEAAQALCSDTHPAAPIFPKKARKNSIVFMFSGQGSQYINMCKDLYEQEPYFKQEVDTCAEALLPHLDLDIRTILFPENDGKEEKNLINQTYLTQPSLFVIEYSLAKLLIQWGVTPKAMVGHSIGEYVAACLAGVFSLDDALALVAARGRMMQDLEPGAMLAVPLSEDETKKILPKELSIAVINAPQLTVVSGTTDEIEKFQEHLQSEHQLEGKPLHTSHAFHSNMMEPILAAFTERVASMQRNSPKLPFVSNVSGEWITPEQATSPEYWATHLREAVRFYDCISTLLGNKFKHFLEVGPGQVLSQLTKQHPDSEKSCIFTTTRRPVERKEDLAEILKGLGQLWSAGISIDWRSFYADQSQNKLPLPTYPFQRKSYWIEAPQQPQAVTTPAAGPRVRPVTSAKEPEVKDTPAFNGPRNDLELQISTVFSELLGLQKIDIRSNFFDIGGDSLLAANLLANLSKTCDSKLSLADIFENPTIEELATLITSGGGNVRSSILPLNDGKGEHLIYFVVGIHIYHALAQELEDTASCFGTFLPAEEALFNSGANSNQWTASDLAAAYRKEIEKHSNGRPLTLVGVSFGGVVAYELARQFEERGQTVPLLVMLDSLLPSGMQRDYVKWLKTKSKELNTRDFGKLAGKIKSKLSAKAGIRKRQSDACAPQAPPIGGAPGFVPDQRLLVYADAVDRFEAMEVTTTYGGRTLLVAAQDAIRGPGFRIDPHFGWKKHIAGEFHLGSAPGDHLGILKVPNVEKTAEIIRGILLNGK